MIDVVPIVMIVIGFTLLIASFVRLFPDLQKERRLDAASTEAVRAIERGHDQDPAGRDS